MSKPTEKEVSDLRGTEFKFTFTDSNGELLSGNTVDAYVAQSDLGVGITIKGLLPKHLRSEYGHGEKVLQCCQHNGEPESKDYLDMVRQYINLIKHGKSLPQVGGGASAEEMELACPFS